MKKVIFIAPPNGSKYGFPKAMPESLRISTIEEREAWLVSEGYPKSEIDSLGSNFICNYWEEEVEDSN